MSPEDKELFSSHILERERAESKMGQTRLYFESLAMGIQVAACLFFTSAVQSEIETLTMGGNVFSHRLV